jgi:hypothetical protein
VNDTITDVANPRKAASDSVAAQLIEQARADGVSLVGAGSPLALLTRQVLETALEVELAFWPRSGPLVQDRIGGCALVP